ncbi:expressed unknown protein [Seminavis robusta]|uniref:Uncharacterized protein n=1 Tax=Seminavis robusta TaxID=568900 RepID=A0A9N8DYF0_9STRA|nr:expressed unknown protein [Seminavis robusta]|eukprot:Sro474_g150240.1 n/a (565) ;mRNA; f:32028-33722
MRPTESAVYRGVILFGVIGTLTVAKQELIFVQDDDDDNLSGGTVSYAWEWKRVMQFQVVYIRQSVSCAGEPKRLLQLMIQPADKKKNPKQISLYVPQSSLQRLLNDVEAHMIAFQDSGPKQKSHASEELGSHSERPVRTRRDMLTRRQHSSPRLMGGTDTRNSKRETDPLMGLNGVAVKSTQVEATPKLTPDKSSEPLGRHSDRPMKPRRIRESPPPKQRRSDPSILSERTETHAPVKKKRSKASTGVNEAGQLNTASSVPAQGGETLASEVIGSHSERPVRSRRLHKDDASRPPRSRSNPPDNGEKAGRRDGRNKETEKQDHHESMGLRECSGVADGGGDDSKTKVPIDDKSTGGTPKGRRSSSLPPPSKGILKNKSEPETKSPLNILDIIPLFSGKRKNRSSVISASNDLPKTTSPSSPSGRHPPKKPFLFFLRAPPSRTRQHLHDEGPNRGRGQRPSPRRRRGTSTETRHRSSTRRGQSIERIQKAIAPILASLTDKGRTTPQGSPCNSKHGEEDGSRQVRFAEEDIDAMSREDGTTEGEPRRHIESTHTTAVHDSSEWSQ